MRAALLVVPVLLLLDAGPGRVLAAKPRPKQGKAHPTEISREGKILVVRGLEGGEPQLTGDDGEHWLLVGLLKEELLRLDGHKLKAWGVPGAKKLTMPTIEVNRYDITDSGGGRKPLVGVLRHHPSGQAGLILERSEGASIEIKGSKPLMDRMAKRLRCKVWLVGDLEGQAVKVFKFGWLNCKPPKNIKTGKETK